jgi:hypothetical protein
MSVPLVPGVPFVPLSQPQSLSHGTRLGDVPWDTRWQLLAAITPPIIERLERCNEVSAIAR